MLKELKQMTLNLLLFFLFPLTLFAITDEQMCEVKMNKWHGRSPTDKTYALQHITKKPFRGFFIPYQEGGPYPLSLILETNTTKFFYTEDCDICGLIVSCSKGKVGKGGGELVILNSGHRMNCNDLPGMPAIDILYSACH